MISNIQDVEIPQNNPFENDLLARDKVCEKIAEDLKNLNGHLTLSINGEWGGGKTTFVRMLKTLLENKDEGEKPICLYFDAFKSDINDDAFFALISKFYNGIEQMEAIKGSKDEFLKKLLSFCKAFGSNLFKTTTKTLLKNLSPSVEEAFENTMLNGQKEILSTFLKREEELNNLKKIITNIAKKIKDKTSYPLVFIIDELDRCRPNYALEILECIKHIFTTDNVCFVLAMNKEQIISSIKHIYGPQIDAETYLHKFIDIEFNLSTSNNQTSGMKDFIDNLKFSSISETDSKIKKTLYHCSQVESIAAREIQKISTMTQMYFKMIPDTDLAHKLAEIVVLLAYIKLFYNKDLVAFMNREISLEIFWETTKMDKMFEETYRFQMPINKEYTFSIFKAWATPQEMGEEIKSLCKFCTPFHIEPKDILLYLVNKFDFYNFT